MLDIRFVRASPEIIKADLTKRNDPEKIAWVDDLLTKDARSRELKVDTDVLRQRRNTIARDINAAKKAGQDADAPHGRSSSPPRKIKANDTEQEEIKDCDQELPDAPPQYSPRERAGGKRRYGECSRQKSRDTPHF